LKAVSALPDAAFSIRRILAPQPAGPRFPPQLRGFIALAPQCIKFESIAVISNFSRIRFKIKFNHPKI
jgi:hypothetical protein